MKTSILFLTAFRAMVISFLFAGCSDHQVAVPADPSMDAAPIVTITNIIKEGSIEPPFAASISGQNVVDNPYYHTKLAYCTPNTQIQLVISAVNDKGGVKDLSVIIKLFSGVVLYQGSTSAPLDANGRGPNQLNISVGTQTGHPALNVTVQDTQHAIFVEVDSHNFNNQETHYVGEYITH